MYVEYYHRSEMLGETIEQLSDLRIEVTNLATAPETPLRAVCAVTGVDHSTFAAAAATDSSVEECKLLEEGSLRRLYWVKTVPGTIDERAYAIAIDAGAIYLRSQRVEGRWHTTMNYPDQESFQEFQRRITDAGLGIEPMVVRVGQYLLSSGTFDLTEKQEVVLAEALDAGYFEVPRGATLSDISDRLSISEQAASERLRRAMDALACAAVTTYREE